MNKKLRSAIKERYTKWTPYGEFICVYCGNTANTIDHAPAIINSYCYGLSDILHLEVPCCQVCNSTLGSIEKHSLRSRSQYLYDTILKQHKSILNSVEWLPSELRDLSIETRRQIRQVSKCRDAIEDKLEFLIKTVDLYEAIEQTLDDINLKDFPIR